jgi:hypothetical protein
MRPYGMTRDEHGDTDVNGCVTNGRATSVYNLKGKGGDIRSYHSLRGGKKDWVRRFAKRRARREGREEAMDHE